MRRLADAFRDGGGRAEPAGDAALEARLGAALDAAAAAHPGLAVDRAAVACALGAAAGDAGAGALTGLHVDDLYVACGCLAGAPAAIAWIDRQLVDKVRPQLARLDASPDRLDELIQQARAHLLVGEPGAPPRIASYRGRGNLVSWIAVATHRLAIEAHRRERPHEPLDAVVDELADQLDPELAYVKQRYGRVYRTAIAGAIDELDDRARLVLRLSLIENVSHDRIAALYRVNQSTVTRWIARAHDRITEGALRRLRDELGLSSTELASLTRLVRSQLELSVGRLLASSKDPAPLP